MFASLAAADSHTVINQSLCQGRDRGKERRESRGIAVLPVPTSPLGGQCQEVIQC